MSMTKLLPQPRAIIVPVNLTISARQAYVNLQPYVGSATPVSVTLDNTSGGDSVLVSPLGLFCSNGAWAVRLFWPDWANGSSVKLTGTLTVWVMDQ